MADPHAPIGDAQRRPKIAVVVRDDLADWQRLNLTAFAASGICAVQPELVGEPYRDGSDRTYTPMFGYPVLVFAGDRQRVVRAFRRSIERGLTVAVYTDELFATYNDADNRAAIAATPTEQLSVAGFAVAGAGRQVDKALDKLELHR